MQQQRPIKLLHRKQELKLDFCCMQAVRDKVVSNLATSLEKAAAELKKEGHAEGLPDATAVARAVEQALQKAFSTSHSCVKAQFFCAGNVTTRDASGIYVLILLGAANVP